jgi:hypothetical protein
LTSGDLPTWARRGFGSPSGWDFVTSSGGDIVGVLFGTLHSPPLNGSTNKILWISRDPSAGELTVTAQLVGATTVVDVGDVSFGPSIIDMPDAGCWRFTLNWRGGPETVDITYASA